MTLGVVTSLLVVFEIFFSVEKEMDSLCTDIIIMTLTCLHEAYTVSRSLPWCI